MKAKRLLSVLLCIMLTISLMPAEVLAADDTYGAADVSAAQTVDGTNGPDNPFGDVDSGDWFFDDVNFVFTSGLMNGIDTGSQEFGPGMSMSRAMLVTVLYRLAGSPDTSGLANTFTDVAADAWYSSAAAWAAANGIINGMGGSRFAPDDNITREQAAAILLRYARLIGKAPVGDITGGVDFADKDMISDWALEGAVWCSMNGILTGRPGASGMLFDPRGNATRAELAAMLHRVAVNVTGTGETPAAPTSGAISGSDSNSSSSSGNSLRISFEPNGGTAISPVSLPRGSKLMNAPIPVKEDSVFTGWYSDNSLTQPFYSDVPVTQSMTLYASYADRDYNYTEYVNSVKFMEDCEPDVTFDILSEETINDANLDEYITIADKTNSSETPELEVTSLGGDVYAISPETSYIPGDTYELSLIDEDISFNNEQEEVRTMAFSIIKQEIYEVDYEDGILYLCWSDVQTVSSGVYSIRNDASVYSIGSDATVNSTAPALTITSGSTICLTDGPDEDGNWILNENSRIRNVLSIVDITGSDPARRMLFTEAATAEDVYGQLEIYLKSSLNPDYLASNFDMQKLAADVKKSEGAMQLTKLLAVTLNESKTVQSLSSPGGAFTPFTDPWENDYKLSLTIDKLIEGLTVTASIGTAIDTNFQIPQIDDNNWVVLTLAFDYNATINNVINVDASFTFKEYFTLEEGMNVGTYYVTDENGNLTGKEKLLSDFYIDAYSHTKMHFSILVKTVDVDGYFDVSAEINGIIQKLTKEDNTEVPQILQDVLGAKGDYIDLAVVDLYDYVKDIQMPAPVLQVKLDIDFVVRLNLAAGLSADYNLLSANRIGIRFTEDFKYIDTYSYELNGSGKQQFDLYAAGYIGVKAGIRADLSIAFYGLEGLGSVGMTGEVGAYMDLYGFLQMHLKVAKTGAKPDVNINGGLYMEVGLYVELKVYVKSEWFKAKAEATLVDMKFPFFHLGDKYALLSFKNADKTVLMNSNRYPLGTGGLLDCTIIDLTTGEVTKDYNKLKDFYFTVSNPYFHTEYWEGDSMITGSFNKPNTIVIRPGEFGDHSYGGIVIPEGTQRLDATVEVYYGGDILCYSSQKPGYTYNKINLTWIDPGIDATKLTDVNAVTATYVVDKNGVKTTVATKPVFAGTVPGPIDLPYTAEVIGYENDWNAAIWQDTTFTVYLSPLQVLADYIYFRDGQWHYEVYAAEAGETFPVPADYLNPGPEMDFGNWMRTEFSGQISAVREERFNVSESFILRAEYRGLAHAGYDKSKAVYTFTGSKEECDAEYNEFMKATPIALHNEGYYYNQKRFAEFIYPEMNYTAFGQTFSIGSSGSTEYFNYGERPAPGTPRIYPFCTILGWATSPGGPAEYAYDGLPPLTHPKGYGPQYYLVVEFTQHVITFNAGNGARFPLGPDTYGYNTYSVVYDYGVEADLSAIPVPVKAADNYNAYTLSGWQDEGGVTYGLNAKMPVVKGATAKYLTAQYTAAPITYTITFDAGNGQFADGSKTKTISGTYLQETTAFSAVGEPTPPEGSAQLHYEFDRWSEGVPATFTQNKTITAVYQEVANVYDITFHAGEGASFPGIGTSFTLEDRIYGYEVELSSVSTPVKPPDENYSYMLTGWRDQDNNEYDLEDTLVVQEDTTLTAIFTQAVRTYTITVSAGNGKFSDNTNIKDFTGTYGQTTDFSSLGSLLPPAEYPGCYKYEFADWSAAFPDTFTQDMTITANYREVYFEHTITFDANGGYFDGDPVKTTVAQTCTYGAIIVPPADPTRPDTTYFEYEFDRWNPALSAGVITGDRTYTATWRPIATGALPASDITVSKGEVTESISGGTISGYDYWLEDVWYDGTLLIPTLTITENGLTISGADNGVYIVIADTVDSVTFSDLDLSSCSMDRNALFVEEGGSPLTINIEGGCSFESTLADGSEPMYIDHREVQFAGTDQEEDSLSISNSGGSAVYINSGLTFENLDLTVTAEATDGASISDRAAIGGELEFYVPGGEASYQLNFVNSDVTVTSDFWGISAPKVMIDHSNVTITPSVTAAPGEESTPAAIMAAYGITLTECFEVSGATYGPSYYTDGTTILFYTFADGGGDPMAQVVILIP